MQDKPHFMGIDGGGSNLRVTIVDAALNPAATAKNAAANPNTIGWDTAQDRIRATMRDAIAQSGLPASAIRGVGIGIGGAEASRAESWLYDTVYDALPNAVVAPSGDHEIALVGAHGQKKGVLILSGTGSIAYGIDDKGESVLVGGWGYLLGDEGSGYWMGMQALQAAICATETRGRPTTLTKPILDANDLHNRDAVINWVYAEGRQRLIARFATLVLEHAAEGDAVALDIVNRAAYELALLTTTVYHRLDMQDLPLAFAGSLLRNENLLQERLCAHLKLDKPPLPRYEPVIGAAILARDYT